MSSNKAIRSNGTYRAERVGKLVFVSILPDELKRVKLQFPHSGIESEQIIFSFRHDNGELVDYEPSRLLEYADGLAIKELTLRARDFAKSVKLIEVQQ